MWKLGVERGVGQPVVVDPGRGDVLRREQLRVFLAEERGRLDRLRLHVVGDAVAAIDAVVAEDADVAVGDDDLRGAVVNDVVGENRVLLVVDDDVLIRRGDVAVIGVLPVRRDDDRRLTALGGGRRGGDFLRPQRAQPAKGSYAKDCKK